MEFNYHYYLEEVLEDTDDYYEHCDTNITKTKKLWLEDIKKRLNNTSNEDYIHYFEKGLNKYGKMKSEENPIEIRLELYSSCYEEYSDNTKLLDFISK